MLTFRRFSSVAKPANRLFSVKDKRFSWTRKKRNQQLRETAVIARSFTSTWAHKLCEFPLRIPHFTFCFPLIFWERFQSKHFPVSFLRQTFQIQLFNATLSTRQFKPNFSAIYSIFCVKFLRSFDRFIFHVNFFNFQFLYRILVFFSTAFCPRKFGEAMSYNVPRLNAVACFYRLIVKICKFPAFDFPAKENRNEPWRLTAVSRGCFVIYIKFQIL